MSKKMTLVVVGAGASKEANLPVGSELKREIAAFLDIRFEDEIRRSSGDRFVYDAIQESLRRTDGHLRNINLKLHAAWQIRDAMPLATSIDAFIDAHQEDPRIELCGKLAIVRAILNAERSSLLYYDTTLGNNRLNYESLEYTWYNEFFQLLTDSCRLEQLEERLSSIGMVVFNYDRCIEQFMVHAIQTYYRIDEREAARFVGLISIYHPYGTVGALPWQGGPHTVEFGAEVDFRRLADLVGEIKTFTEGLMSSQAMY